MTSKVPGLISFILMIILYSCHSVIKQTPKKQGVDSLVYEDPEPKLLFGIPIDSSKVIESQQACCLRKEIKIGRGNTKASHCSQGVKDISS